LGFLFKNIPSGNLGEVSVAQMNQSCAFSRKRNDASQKTEKEKNTKNCAADSVGPSVRGHCVRKEVPVIPFNRENDTKRMIGKNEGPGGGEAQGAADPKQK
jgi:hypothetical protein